MSYYGYVDDVIRRTNNRTSGVEEELNDAVQRIDVAENTITLIDGYVGRAANPDRFTVIEDELQLAQPTTRITSIESGVANLESIVGATDPTDAVTLNAQAIVALGADTDALEDKTDEISARIQTRMTRGLYVPFYQSPTTPYTNTEVGKLVTLARGARERYSVTIVVNPASGPGASANGDYTATIDLFNGAGAYPIGYVSTARGTRNTQLVLDDIDAWYAYYPGIRGIFLDEGPSDADDTPAIIDKYKQYYARVKSKGSAHVCDLNPGTYVESILTYRQQIFDFIVTWENDVYPTETEALGGATSTAARNHDARYRVAIVHGRASLNDVTAIANLYRWFGMVFITQDTLPNPFDASTNYYDDLAELLDRQEGYPQTQPSTNAIVGDRADLARGANAVDLQTARQLDLEVASGTRSALVGGQDNVAAGNGSAVIGGTGSNAAGAGCAAIGGNTASIDASCSDCAVVAGVGCSMANDCQRCLVTGDTNSLENVEDVVVTGTTNSANNCAHSTILGGVNGTLNANYATILGGLGTTMSGNHGVILGGEECAVEKNCGRNVVGGFQCKVFDHVDGGSWNALCVGYQCEVKQNSHSCLLTGAGNKIVDSDDTAIAGGLNNSATGSTRSFIAGGQYNQVNTGSVGSACIGSYNHINAAHGIALGNAAEINHADSVVISSNGTTTREPSKRANQIYQFVQSQPSFRKNNKTEYHFQMRMDSIEGVAVYATVGYLDGTNTFGHFAGVLEVFSNVVATVASTSYHGVARFSTNHVSGTAFTGVAGTGAFEDKLGSSDTSVAEYTTGMEGFDVNGSGILTTQFKMDTLEAGVVTQVSNCVFTLITDPGVEPPVDIAIIASDTTASLVW